MYEKKIVDSVRCPLEYGLSVFGGKWKSRIICVLAGLGTLRYSAIRKEMTDITDAVLSGNLRELEADGIIIRKQYPEIPPRVEYMLSEKGQSIVPILQSICRWSGAYRKKEEEQLLKQCEKCDYNK